MTSPTLMQAQMTPKTRRSRRERIDRIVRRAVRRAVCECEARPMQVSARTVAVPV